MHLSEIITQVIRVAPKADRSQIDAMLNLVQRQYIQPVANITAKAEYTVITMNEEVLMGDISVDMYKINYIFNTDSSTAKVQIPLLGPEEVNTVGVRIEDTILHMQNLVADTDLEIHYFKKLTPLGGGTGKTDEPDIPEDWHDLYWLGAGWMLNQEQNLAALFWDRLNAFRQERNDAAKQPGFRIRKKW